MDPTFSLKSRHPSEYPSSREREEPRPIHSAKGSFDEYDEITGDIGPLPPPPSTTTAKPDDEDIDPLDAFMAEIEAIETTQDARRQPQKEAVDTSLPPAKRHKPERFFADVDDHVADLFEARYAGAQGATTFVRSNIHKQGLVGDEESFDSDEDVYRAAADAVARQPTEVVAGRAADLLLPPVDHASINYEPFKRQFYQPRPELANLNGADVAARRKALDVRVTGAGHIIPAPVESFEQCRLDRLLMTAIAKAGYEKPTPIQAQALPVILSGRDVLGIAPTGSGKSAAFLLPMVTHVMDQRHLQEGEGPIALIVAPTRELAEQIHREARKLGKPYNLAVCAAFGGLQRHHQVKELKGGAEVAVCTPGRWIDLLKAKACNCRRITYVVLDEADRMFAMGFEQQVRTLLGQLRPDRQTVLFSATMPRKLSRLASETLATPVRITVGASGVANTDVKQVFDVLPTDDAKTEWLLRRLESMVDEGDVLVFVSQRAKAEALAASLGALGCARVAALHGDMDQASRSDVVASLKAGKLHVVVATDVAARGLDIKTCRTVVNFDPAKDIDTHIHRVGRTGRAGDKEGIAYTLLLPTDTKQALELARSLEAAFQDVPVALNNVAAKDPRARKQTSGKWQGSGVVPGGHRKGQPRGGGVGIGFSAAEASLKDAGTRRLAVDSGSDAGYGNSGAHATAAGPAKAIVDAASLSLPGEKVEARDGAREGVSPLNIPGFLPSRAPASPSTFVAPSHEHEVERSGPARFGAYQPQQQQLQEHPPPQPLPPPPMPPPYPQNVAGQWSDAVGYGALPPPQQQLRQPVPPPPQKSQQQPYSNAAPAYASIAQPVPAQPTAAGVAPGTSRQGHTADGAHRATWQDAKRGAIADHFRSSFVSSGVRQNTGDAKPVIVLPKKSSASSTGFRPPLPPPPIPVTQRPLHQQHAGSSSGTVGANTPNAVELAKAVAQARAVAARLAAARAPGMGGPPTSL